MASIGNFTATDEGYLGTVRTLTVNCRARFVPNIRSGDAAPDYRILANGFDIGAAWKRTSQADKPYLSVTLDDPSFPATINANLVEGEDGTHQLLWSRTRRD